MLSLNETLREIAAAVATFLQDNDGMKNGYRTYAMGKVDLSIRGSVTWCTPLCEELTGRQVAARGELLNSIIRKILRENGYSQCELIAKNMEHGTYNTLVSISTYAKVNL